MPSATNAIMDFSEEMKDVESATLTTVFSMKMRWKNAKTGNNTRMPSVNYVSLDLKIVTINVVLASLTTVF